MRVALVLGSGGARGYAHIGVIEELKSRGHEIVAIGGASMGALVGGFEAAGKLAEFTEMAVSLTQGEVIRLADLSLTEPGFLGLRRVSHRLHEILGPAMIDDLPIPYTAVAADLLARREVWFTSGSLLAAIRASISIPVAFTPVRIDGRVLVDGGVLNPLPLETVTAANADVTVAVSLLGRDPAVGLSTEADERELTRLQQLDEWTGRVRADAQDLWRRSWLGTLVTKRNPAPPEPGDTDEVFQPLPKGLTTIDVMMKALDAMQAAISSARTGSNPPDVLVSLPADAYDTSDFHRAAEIIEAGRELAIDTFNRARL